MINEPISFTLWLQRIQHSAEGNLEKSNKIDSDTGIYRYYTTRICIHIHGPYTNKRHTNEIHSPFYHVHSPVFAQMIHYSFAYLLILLLLLLYYTLTITVFFITSNTLKTDFQINAYFFRYIFFYFFPFFFLVVGVVAVVTVEKKKLN